MNCSVREYLEGVKDDITGCSRCMLAERYCKELRARNMRLTIENLPSKIEYLVLAESPPKSYKFFYDLHSDGHGWLGNIVFPGFCLEFVDRPLQGKAKEQLLTELQSKGVIMFDSCQCACNYLGKSDDRERKRAESERRAELVPSCYEQHAREIVNRILESNLSVYILPVFPKNHPGDGVIEALRKQGFQRLSEEKRVLVLPNWRGLAGVWQRPAKRDSA
ncbi:MAG TPA: hypothetical protein VGB78_01490 [Thermoplasmata archaeon]